MCRSYRRSGSTNEREHTRASPHSERTRRPTPHSPLSSLLHGSPQHGSPPAPSAPTPCRQHSWGLQRKLSRKGRGETRSSRTKMSSQLSNTSLCQESLLQGPFSRRSTCFSTVRPLLQVSHQMRSQVQPNQTEPLHGRESPHRNPIKVPPADDQTLRERGYEVSKLHTKRQRTQFKDFLSQVLEKMFPTRKTCECERI